jgi:hypothetical protein
MHKLKGLQMFVISMLEVKEQHRKQTEEEDV